MSESTATRTVVMTHPTGLCLRGASAISHLARDFQSRIELIKDGERVSATDALQVVSLCVEHGVQVDLEATGPDADEALDAMVTLFAVNFGLTE